MPEPFHHVMSYLRFTVGTCRNDPRDDAELLVRFAETRDETAFSTLIWRHGKMVWRTCKAILHDTSDAEDVFQTVFLTMARKAGQLSPKNPAGWLHQVARRAALNALATAQRRQNLKNQLSGKPLIDTEVIDQSEHYAVLDEELARLPEKLRMPLVLRYLEEKSLEEAARILGCSHTSIRRRLIKGEAVLRDRLERRGLALGIGTIAALLGNTAGGSAVPADLVTSTARAAVAFRSETLRGGTAEAAEKLLRALAKKSAVRKLWWVVMACACTFGVGGAGFEAWKMFGSGSNLVIPTVPKTTALKVIAEPHDKRVDFYGDPLPKGALARIGTVRFRGPGIDMDGLDDSLPQPGITFSPDGKILGLYLKKGEKEEICCWETVTGKEVPEYVGKAIIEKTKKKRIRNDNIRGNIIVNAGKDRIVRVSEVKTGKVLYHLGVMERAPTLISFLPDDKTVIVACAGQVRFWDISTHKEARPPLICKGLLFPTIVSPDGTKLIERVGNALSVWDLATGKETGPTAGASRSLMRSLAFSPDGKSLVTVTEPEIFRPSDVEACDIWQGRAAFQIWETATGRSIGSLTVPDDTPVKCWGKVAWPSRDTILASAICGTPTSSAATVFKWNDVSQKNVIAKTDIYPGIGQFSSDGQVLICRQDGDLSHFELSETATGKKFATIPCRSKNPNWEDNLAISRDHQFLATQPVIRDEIASDITLWEVSTGRALYSFNLPPSFVGPLELEKQPPQIDSLIGFSPHNRLVATLNHETHAISLWEHISGQLRMRLAMPAGCNGDPSITFSPDNWLLATGCSIESSEEKVIQVWDLATGRECQRFQGHRKGWEAPSLTFSPDGRQLASAGLDYTVLIWDVKSRPALEETSQPLSPKEFQVLKADLTGLDAAAAWQAMRKLRQTPDEAMLLITECLRPDPASPDLIRITREVSHLIGDLDSDDFQTRMSAKEKLNKRLDAESNKPIVEPLLRQVLAEKPSMETRKTITQLLGKLKEERQMKANGEGKGSGGCGSQELIRMVRAIEILEQLNSDPARELLGKLIDAPPRPEIRREAEAALKRLTASRAVLTH